jgi:hypothetical protein
MGRDFLLFDFDFDFGFPGGKGKGEREKNRLAVLDKANVVGLLAEALTADVEAVLADQTSTVGADAAVQRRVSGCSQSDGGTFFRRCISSMCSSSSSSTSSVFSSLFHRGIGIVPRPGALAVLPRAGVPNGFVRHGCVLRSKRVVGFSGRAKIALW